ncbi:MAG: hypothetical protein K9L87_01805 [Candidatus Omnitrophica bacterium]|nr:hypothetical protein [Candidatus Omnitrophota bacterium]MCF7892003.1 hypothetical protein [Candidatus Omnitrophota bacterium]MCF7896003.1 hypothetical protein [Candidatus Omnitrophota bacterium]MCF7897471.1 hypothetical protein [Candidatus Omnitrophota bacterium]MCF7909252.1 hypothetical protein [Candidatus Omnitrophota bacterium]
MKRSKLFFIICLILIFSVFFSQYNFEAKGFSSLRTEKEGEETTIEEDSFRKNIDNFYSTIDLISYFKISLSHFSRYIALFNPALQSNQLATFLDILFNHSPPKTIR